jgi:hypothetical protein
MKVALNITLAAALAVVVPAHAFAADDPQQVRKDSSLVRSMEAHVATRKPIDSRMIERQFEAGHRSPLMTALYGSLAALSVLDVVTTNGALDRGATELNPLLKDTAGRTLPSLAVKSVATASTMFLVNRMSKKSRPAAYATLIAANIAAAYIVSHNVRQGHAR